MNQQDSCKHRKIDQKHQHYTQISKSHSKKR